MEKSRQFNQEQKLVILEGAKEVGIQEASRIADGPKKESSPLPEKSKTNITPGEIRNFFIPKVLPPGRT